MPALSDSGLVDHSLINGMNYLLAIGLNNPSETVFLKNLAGQIQIMNHYILVISYDPTLQTVLQQKSVQTALTDLTTVYWNMGKAIKRFAENCDNPNVLITRNNLNSISLAILSLTSSFDKLGIAVGSTSPTIQSAINTISSKLDMISSWIDGNTGSFVVMDQASKSYFQIVASSFLDSATALNQLNVNVGGVPAGLI